MRLSDSLTCHEDGWTVIETGWDADRALAVGSNFLAGNGYLGYRATPAEGRAADYVALVVTDTYDMADGRWRELCTVPNPLVVAAMVDGTPVSVAPRQVLKDGECGVPLAVVHACEAGAVCAPDAAATGGQALLVARLGHVDPLEAAGQGPVALDVDATGNASHRPRGQPRPLDGLVDGPLLHALDD